MVENRVILCSHYLNLTIFSARLYPSSRIAALEFLKVKHRERMIKNIIFNSLII